MSFNRPLKVYTPDRTTIEFLVQSGYISSRKHPNFDLWILNYTDKCAYEPFWTEDTLNCRGLIVDADYNVVGRPFKKFFNLNQTPFPEYAEIEEVTEKLDGSLLIVCTYDHNIIVATRGSFISDQAIWANNWILTSGNLNLVALKDWIEIGLTLLFEVIYPENRVVVDYKGFEGIKMIGAIMTNSGLDYPYYFWSTVANDIGVSAALSYDTLNIDELVAQALTMTSNEEGFVIRINDNVGTRFKIKSADYLRIHRLLTHITFKHTLETVASGTYAAAIAEIPDEFLDQVKQWKDEIDHEFFHEYGLAYYCFNQAPKDDRKTFALWVKDNVPHGASYMFSLWDGKDISSAIYKHILEDRKNVNDPLVKDES